MTLYAWLKFFHILGLVTFLLAHGVSAGASLALRGPVSGQTRQLLTLSQRSAMFFYPGLLFVIVTGVWMAFAGSFWGRSWLWAAIVVLVLVIGAMVFIARPYYMAREAAGKSDEELAQALSRTRPIAAAWVGGVALVLLVGLMVLKPF